MIANGTPEQQATIQEEYNKMKEDGIAEEEIEAQLTAKYASEISATKEAAPVKAKKIIISGAPASGKGTQCEWIRFSRQSSIANN